MEGILAITGTGHQAHDGHGPPMQILVPTCEKYSDAWGPFLGLLAKFWLLPEDPDPLFITDSAGIIVPASVISTGADLGWVGHLRRGLDEFEDETIVLVLQEDFFLTTAADRPFVDTCVELLRNEPNTAAVRLYPCPGPDGPPHAHEPRLGIMLPDTQPYLVSCQATLWRARCLRGLTDALMERRGASAASFEILGTDLARRMPHDWLCHQRDGWPWPIEYLCSAITRGAWNPDAIRVCCEQGIHADFSRRPLHT